MCLARLARPYSRDQTVGETELAYNLLTSAGASLINSRLSTCLELRRVIVLCIAYQLSLINLLRTHSFPEFLARCVWAGARYVSQPLSLKVSSAI